MDSDESIKNILTNITFHLCDLDKKIVDEWKIYFEGFVNFKFYNCDIFSVPVSDNTVNAIVSPANSFGDLQGGIDYVYYKHFGHALEERLQRIIMDEKYGELVVGDALILPILGDKYKYFISAPTMRVPMNVENTPNAYLAFRATLIELVKFNKENKQYEINHVVCPGLATSIGKLSAEYCAKQMLYAYTTMIQPNYDLDLMKLSCGHCLMVSKKLNEK